MHSHSFVASPVLFFFILTGKPAILATVKHAASYVHKYKPPATAYDYYDYVIRSHANHWIVPGH